MTIDIKATIKKSSAFMFALTAYTRSKGSIRKAILVSKTLDLLDQSSDVETVYPKM